MTADTSRFTCRVRFQVPLHAIFQAREGTSVEITRFRKLASSHEKSKVLGGDRTHSGEVRLILSQRL